VQCIEVPVTMVTLLVLYDRVLVEYFTVVLV